MLFNYIDDLDSLMALGPSQHISSSWHGSLRNYQELLCTIMLHSTWKGWATSERS
jgi:hypothetical protein